MEPDASESTRSRPAMGPHSQKQRQATWTVSCLGSVDFSLQAPLAPLISSVLHGSRLQPTQVFTGLHCILMIPDQSVLLIIACGNLPKN